MVISEKSSRVVWRDFIGSNQPERQGTNPEVLPDCARVYNRAIRSSLNG
ncbi:hypothetical protein [Paenibacillus sp. QZ-Y1]